MRCKVIAPVGDNLKALFVGIKEFPTDKVYLITPSEKIRDAQKLRDKLEEFTIKSEIITPTDTNIESQNTITNYPYLKREIFQIIGTFGFVLFILIGLTFII